MADTLTGEGFAQGLGTGFLSIWQGVGNNFNATADFNKATAKAIGADADLAGTRLTLQDTQQQRQQNTIIIVFVAVLFLPIILLLISKKKTT